MRLDKLEPSQGNPGLCRTRLGWHLASYSQPSTTFLLLILFLLLVLLLLFLQKVFAVTQLMSVQERQYVCKVLSPQPFCLFGPIFDLLYDFIFTVSRWTLLVKPKISRHWCFIKKALEKKQKRTISCRNWKKIQEIQKVTATNKTRTADTFFVHLLDMFKTHLEASSHIILEWWILADFG